MIGGPSGLAIIGILMKLGFFIGLVVALVMAVTALRKSAREQARIADKLEQIQQSLATSADSRIPPSE